MCCTECSVCICRKVCMNEKCIYAVNTHWTICKYGSLTEVQIWQKAILMHVCIFIQYMSRSAPRFLTVRVTHIDWSYKTRNQVTPHVCKSVPWLYKYACSKVGRSGELLGEPCEMLLSTCLRKLCIFRSASDSKGRLAKQKWGMCYQ